MNIHTRNILELSQALGACRDALLAYAALYDAGPIEGLTGAQQWEQAMKGLRHSTALDPDHAPFISIHKKMNFINGRLPTFHGYAYTNLDNAVGYALWLGSKGHDAYWSMGAQAKPGEQPDGWRNPKANRGEPNIALVRCLYIDIDVKEGSYVTTHAAVEALLVFVQAMGWEPSMIIGSGNGGLHVYWRLPQAVGVKEFRQLAGLLIQRAQACGLQFDKQCTSDPTRLLRVPGTWNFKGGEGTDGKAVTLIYGGNLG
jgi:hypothetical protein